MTSYYAGTFATRQDAVEAAKRVKRLTGKAVRVVQVGPSGNGLRPYRIEIL